MALEKQETQRPMTHDLMANMLKEFGMEVVRVVVTDLQEQTFYARITVKSDGQLKEIDARPSDSIALALRTGSPIFVAKSVWSESSIDTDNTEITVGKETVGEKWVEATPEKLGSLQKKAVSIRVKKPPEKRTSQKRY